MRIVRTVQSCRVDNASLSELRWLQEFLAVPCVDFAGGKPRPTVRRYFDSTRRTFMPGLLRLVQREATRGEGFVVDIIDERERPAGELTIPKSFRTKKPHAYQLEAVRKAWAGETTALELGTSAGKSFIAAIAFASVPFRCLYVVATEHLAEQAAAEFELETGERCARMYSGRYELNARCVFATFGTLWARMKAVRNFARDCLSGFGWLIVDECEGVAATTFQAVATAVSAFFRTGMSATVTARSDGKAMAVLAATGPICFRKSLKELAEEGHASMATVRMVRYSQEAFVGKWQDAYTYQVVKDAGRNALVATIAALAKKPCLVLFNDVAHGAALLRALQARGVNAERIDGRATVGQRKSDSKRLDAGTVDVLVASKIMRTGVNIRKLRSVVNAAGRKSEREVVQGMGRGARLASEVDKDEFDVWDVLDVAADGRAGKGRWVANHATQRLRVYREQGYDVLVADAPRGPWETHASLAVPKRPKRERKVTQEEDEDA